MAPSGNALLEYFHRGFSEITIQISHDWIIVELDNDFQGTSQIGGSRLKFIQWHPKQALPWRTDAFKERTTQLFPGIDNTLL